jgi:hypothetical protein
MRTLRRITAATALAAASFVPAAHAAPPVPGIPRPPCEMFDVAHTGFCGLLPHDDFYVFAPCKGEQTVPGMSGHDNVWAFSGGVGGGEWVGSVTTHCYVGDLRYGAKSDPVPGPVGFLAAGTGLVPAGATSGVCTQWDVTFVQGNPYGYDPNDSITFRPDGC